MPRRSGVARLRAALIGWTLVVPGRGRRARTRGRRRARLLRRGHGGRPSRTAREDRLRTRPAFLPDAPARARRHPRCSAPRRPRDPPGDAKDQWRTILDAENEAFRDHWGHREMGESDFRATFGRAELDTSLWVVAWDGDQVAGVVENWIWAEENERARRQARLARADQRSAPVAAARAGPGDHRGLAGQPARGRARRGMLGVDSENANGALGAVRGPRLRGPQPFGGLSARLDRLTARRGQAKRRPVATLRAPSRPARDRSSWRAVTREDADVRSSSPVSRASDATIAAGSPPGRSTRPQAPAKSVSPLYRSPSSSARRQTEPSVCPACGGPAGGSRRSG